MLEAYRSVLPQVDPSAFVHASAVLIGDVVIGAEASVWPHATFRGDVGKLVLGPRANVQDNAVIHCTGGLSTTTIGAQVTVGHGVIVHGATIADNCLIGMGAIILDNAEIGEYCLIGAGSLVTQRKRIPAGSLVIGNPGRVVRAITDEEREWIDRSWRSYVAHAKAYKAEGER